MVPENSSIESETSSIESENSSFESEKRVTTSGNYRAQPGKCQVATRSFAKSACVCDSDMEPRIRPRPSSC